MTTRPKVAFIRGAALNPYEAQSYALLRDEFEVIAIGGRRVPDAFELLDMPLVGLRSANDHRVTRAAFGRIGRRWPTTPDATQLIGLNRLVADSQILHSAETVLSISDQAARIASKGTPKLVLTCWETIPFRFDDDDRLARRKERVKGHVARFIAVTDRAREALVTEGVDPTRIVVVPAGVDAERFRPRPIATEIRSSWGVPTDATVVLYVGRLIHEKGVVELVRSFAACSASDHHLVVVGNGNQGPRIARAARALGVERRVHIRPGAPYDVMPSVFAAADIVVAPSLPTPYWEEQFGMVLIEAMASGRALITTASGAIPEVVGDAAMLVPPYDVHALSTSLDELLRNVERRAEFADAGRARVEARYSTHVVSDQLRQVYRYLIATPTRS
jgi:alpha-maltose-1-phosphate synthase